MTQMIARTQMIEIAVIRIALSFGTTNLCRLFTLAF